MTNGERMQETLDMIIRGELASQIQFTKELAKFLKTPSEIDGPACLLAVCEAIFERQPNLLSDMNSRIFGKMIRKTLEENPELKAMIDAKIEELESESQSIDDGLIKH